MSAITGKWQQPAGQPYPGLWFKFYEDGTFRAEYPEMGIVSSGTFTVDGEQIDMNQAQHTLGFTGLFLGLWKVEGDTLKMAVGQVPGQRPTDFGSARTYNKISE